MTIPATVRIVDLPIGTTLSGVELLEAVQTSNGVGNSIQVSVAQIGAVSGGLPGGGGAGQFLQKSGTALSANIWGNISANVVASTGLAQSGSTTVSLSLASTAGLSVLGVGGIGSAVPAALVGVADQVLIINHAGSSATFGPVNLAAAAAVTGVLPTGNGGLGSTVYLNFGNASALLPPTQNTPVSALAAAGGTYNDSGSGNIFQFSSWADNMGTRPTVGVFGQGRALGTSSLAWGGNFVAYAGATGAFAQAAEIDFGVTGGITSQQAFGLSVNAGGSTGSTVSNTVVGLNFDQLASTSLYTDAIRFSNFAGHQPYVNALINVFGTTALTPKYGINFTNLSASVAAWASPGFTIGTTGNVAAANMTVGTLTAATVTAVNVVCTNFNVGTDFATNSPQTIASTSGTVTNPTVVLTSSVIVTLTLPGSPLPGQWETITWHATATTVNSASVNVVPLLSSTAVSTILNAAGPTKWCDLQWDGSHWQVMRGV